MDQRANKGILITPSDYTQQAYDFADGKNIELINGTILQTLLATKFEDTYENATQNETTTFRNERYFYYQQIILDEPNRVSNYLQIIEYLREYIKEQDSKMCTIELFSEIIEWTNKMINRCYKTKSKAHEKNMAMMIIAEILIHIGKLAEATELLLKCKRFFIYDEFGHYNLNRTVLYGYQMISWNLYTAYRLINYERGCNLLLSKREAHKKEIPSYFADLFVYPIPNLECTSSATTEHLTITGFNEKESKNPMFFYDRFYNKTHEEYAKEIDEVFKLYGLL